MEDEVNVAEVFSSFRGFVQGTIPQLRAHRSPRIAPGHSEVFRPLTSSRSTAGERVFFERLRVMDHHGVPRS